MAPTIYGINFNNGIEMDNIPLEEIYQHKLNFLIGAGASTGLFPTLWLAVKDSIVLNKEETIETLATKLDELGKKEHHTLLFMYYYKEIIEPVCKFRLTNPLDARQQKTIENYEIFIDSVIRLLQHKNNFSRQCNLFTTNYDGCIPFVADKILKRGGLAFHINDGSSGFLEKTLLAKNFNTYLCESGIFGMHSTDIPQINYISLHGSAYWRKSDESISVNYGNSETNVVIPVEAGGFLLQLTDILNDSTKTTEDVLALEIDISDEIIENFWKSYNKLPIVNPTKWKFHETVFEEHYYQMLRLLSYKLEEPNSILITFAFSFADEHILNLVRRSLSNPKLQVFVCCFDKNEEIAMQKRFNSYRNVKFIVREQLDFTMFNESVFNASLLRDFE